MTTKQINAEAIVAEHRVEHYCDAGTLLWSPSVAGPCLPYTLACLLSGEQGRLRSAWAAGYHAAEDGEQMNNPYVNIG